jgi:hypothetical protein
MAVTGSGGVTGVAGIGSGGATGTGGMMLGTGGMMLGTGGMMLGTGGKMGTGGMGTGGMGTGGMGTGGMGTGGMGTGGMGTGGSGSSGGGNNITGTLPALKPILHGFATTNGPETLIYLTSADIKCSDIMTMGVGWLMMIPASDIVIEIVIPGTASVGMKMVAFLSAELNYANGGGTPNANEHVADSGTINFTKADPMGVFEGTLMGSYPGGTIMGSFHADWCEGGSEY